MAQVIADEHELEKTRAREEYQHTVVAFESAITRGERPTLGRLQASRRSILRLERAGLVALYVGGKFDSFDDKIKPDDTIQDALGLSEDSAGLRFPEGYFRNTTVSDFVAQCRGTGWDPLFGLKSERVEEVRARLLASGFGDIYEQQAEVGAAS